MYLGLCYARGEGTPADPAKAVECYRRAAEGGEPMAMGLLAECLEEGRGVATDEAEAVNWYRRGAENGELACLAQLGECYEYGRGVPKDLAKALECYREAKQQGFEPVQPAIERVEEAMRCSCTVAHQLGLRFLPRRKMRLRSRLVNETHHFDATANLAIEDQVPSDRNAVRAG